MTRFKSHILTDLAADLWLDSFTASNATLRLPTQHDWSIHKRTLRGGRRNGVDIIDVQNGALSYSVLPTRGMGLWRGQYHGVPLSWKSPVLGPVHPRHVQLNDRGGLGFLEGFDELLCRCGLASNGPPGEDVVTDKSGRILQTLLTLHGRIANASAHFVEVRINPDPPFELSVVGIVEEGALFCPHLRLTSTITTVPGSNRLVIHDVIENRSAQSAEMQILYHCNLGPPFLDAGSRVMTPIKEMAPQTACAAEGIETFDTYGAPVAGFAEQVYLYDLLSDASGRTLALLYNRSADHGLTFRWNRKELPCFTLWKCTGALEDGYVTGLEPATNFPNFKTFERNQGRVPSLLPSGRWECTLSIEVHDNAAGVSGVLAEIASLQAHAPAVIHRKPCVPFAPV